MSFDSELYHRRSIRLKGYDYSNEGFYFITLCTHKHECLFGKIKDNQMFLNIMGQIVKETWLEVENDKDVELFDFIVMPNHFHAIISIVGAIHESPEKEEFNAKAIHESPYIPNREEKCCYQR